MSSARLAKKGVTKGLSAFGRAREGAIAATVGMSLTVMAGFLALAFHVGNFTSLERRSGIDDVHRHIVMHGIAEIAAKRLQVLAPGHEEQQGN